jgi:glyoxylate reductase
MFGAAYEPDLDRLFAEADIVTLHAPAGSGTHHMVDAARLAAMKPTAYLINTARGDLIDEEALITALQSGHIAGAGLDVFAREPQVDLRLIALPNVITLPHLGSATVEGRALAGEKVIANIRFWVDGHRPPDQVLEGWA